MAVVCCLPLATLQMLQRGGAALARGLLEAMCWVMIGRHPLDEDKYVHMRDA